MDIHNRRDPHRDFHSSSKFCNQRTDQPENYGDIWHTYEFRFDCGAGDICSCRGDFWRSIGDWHCDVCHSNEYSHIHAHRDAAAADSVRRHNYDCGAKRGWQLTS